MTKKIRLERLSALREMAETEITEGTILESDSGGFYMAAQIGPGAFQFISQRGNRWADVQLRRSELQEYAENEGFRVIGQGGFL